MAPPPEDRYPPEIIVLLSSYMSNDASHCDFFHPIFCDRIIRLEHIPKAESIDESKNSRDNEKSRHVHSWDHDCGWTKLRLFELESYDTVLYIDADCLVLKDVGQLLHIDETPISLYNYSTRRVGLLAAAPDVFHSDRFNAGVMVLRPSKTVFQQMMSRLPNSSPKVSDSTELSTSYDGDDTGFLNAFYPGWYTEMPSYSRLSFAYNKQPKYWDDAIEDLRIIHFSSSPKPWERNINKSPDEMKERNKLESMWHDAYERSQQYYSKEFQKQSLLKRRRASDQRKSPPSASSRSTTTHSSEPPPSARLQQQNPHRLAQRRYKELRKSGVDVKEAMLASRKEFGLDKADDKDASKAVGKMFGLA